MKVLVVGAGTMGSGIAQVSAMSGYDTVVVDVSKEFLDRGRERIMDSLQRLSKRGVDPSTVLSKLTFSTEMKDGSGAEVAIEVVPEKLEIKLDVFKRMESILSSGSLLATNTSSIPISEIASGIERKQMLVGLHFFNPPPLMMLVEVIPSKFTESDAMERALKFVKSLGKVPVRLAYEVPGFVSNRVFMRILQEACREVEAGEASVEEVDSSARAIGLPMGIFELADYTGIDVIVDIWNILKQRGMVDVPCSMYSKKVSTGELGVKSGRGFYSYPAPGKFVKSKLNSQPKVPPARLLSLAVNEAAWLISNGVVRSSDIDTVMKLGFNFPKGLVEMAREIGLREIENQLLQLSSKYKAYSPVSNFTSILS